MLLLHYFLLQKFSPNKSRLMAKKIAVPIWVIEVSRRGIHFRWRYHYIVATTNSKVFRFFFDVRRPPSAGDLDFLSSDECI